MAVTITGNTRVIGQTTVGVVNPPLLDVYSGALVAYSIRKVRTAYTGSCFRVRRSSDNTTLDIGFLSNGNLDTTSLLSFVGASGGYINIWYDQSGNGFNAITNTASLQPLIVSSSTYRFPTFGDSGIAANLGISLTGLNDIASIFSVHQDITQDSTGSIHKPIFAGQVNDVYLNSSLGYGFGKLREGSNGFNFGIPSTGLETANRVLSNYTKTSNYELITGINNQASISLFKNGSSIGTATGNNRTSAIIQEYQLGSSQSGVTNRFYTGVIKEFIIYSTNQSANRAGIELNINNAYNIY